MPGTTTDTGFLIREVRAGRVWGFDNGYIRVFNLNLGQYTARPTKAIVWKLTAGLTPNIDSFRFHFVPDNFTANLQLYVSKMLYSLVRPDNVKKHSF
jgi:hypothetical protein